MKKMSAVFLLSLFCAVPAFAQLQVDEPWVRATVPGQMATGMFARLTYPVNARLIAVSSPIAGKGEIHEMAMEGDIMKMRAIDGLALPAGEAVELKPGSFHIMLMELKEQVQEGQHVPLELVILDEKGNTDTVELIVPVRALTMQQPKAAPHSAH